ncbi:DUF6197 family protein [Nonomuraea sp. LPB2021202275-12-8]|uniref:DUF6197 family protein n=1 Tax=Nonomuraea sp. LPB2021202275-12-8 TaxID=3120159 RepID=UPI00300C8258
MTTLTTVPSKSDLRTGAADLLKSAGWIKGKYCRTDAKRTGVCLVAAISLAAGLPAVALASLKPHSKDADYLARWEVAQNLCSEIATALGRPDHEMAPTRWLSYWNDKPHTTLADVLGALEGEAA